MSHGAESKVSEAYYLALNASSCHHRVTWGQSLLSEPHLKWCRPHLTWKPGACSRVGFEGSRGNFESA